MSDDYLMPLCPQCGVVLPCFAHSFSRGGMSTAELLSELKALREEIGEGRGQLSFMASSPTRGSFQSGVQAADGLLLDFQRRLDALIARAEGGSDGE